MFLVIVHQGFLDGLVECVNLGPVTTTLHMDTEPANCSSIQLIVPCLEAEEDPVACIAACVAVGSCPGGTHSSNEAVALFAVCHSSKNFLCPKPEPNAEDP